MNDSTLNQSEAQMRKGVLVYAVLLLLKDGKVYSSEIISSLRMAELIVVEGTLYPLLNRLARDALLAYEWQESEQGPPRKYYWLTDDGKALLKDLQFSYKKLHSSIQILEKGVKK
ncbi:MAG TPA: PadR family transcriptional regulator [Candidatus Microsaccharimonas sp.]|nr:PadR family transcriptional regulator [Candidatus Microsaccharimonas sp.]